MKNIDPFRVLPQQTFLSFFHSLSHTFFSLVILVDMTPLVFDWLQTKLHANTNTPNYTRRRKKTLALVSDTHVEQFSQIFLSLSG